MGCSDEECNLTEWLVNFYEIVKNNGIKLDKE